MGPTRAEAGLVAEEQAALRRVATLVAGGASPEAVFAAVAAEVGRLPGSDITFLTRYDPDQMATNVGVWSNTGALPIPVGTRVHLDGRNLPTLVFKTRRPARIDDYTHATGPVADVADAWGIRSAVGVPISVEGRLWGVVTVASAGERSLPTDTEARLAGFTELVGTAIANAQARVELRGFAEEQAARLFPSSLSVRQRVGADVTRSGRTRGGTRRGCPASAHRRQVSECRGPGLSPTRCVDHRAHEGSGGRLVADAASDLARARRGCFAVTGATCEAVRGRLRWGR